MRAVEALQEFGMDTGTDVDESYKLPFKFTGTIDKLTFNLGPTQIDGGGTEGH